MTDDQDDQRQDQDRDQGRGNADGRTTVVIITRDQRDELLHTLDQLAELPERPPVIVTDNGSTDGTAGPSPVCSRWSSARRMPC
ncbi:glycosyltransferase family 2 protein, partial [Streptomyces asiaticus]